ncbi:MAG: porin family protein [Methylovulum sp.]|nr:porin family protein [Methylovulum sp.]
MINKKNTVWGIAAATLTIAGALAAPQAVAQTKAERMAEAANNKVEALEAQLQAMQYELQSLKAETNRPVDSAKVQELDQWMASVKSAPVQTKVVHDNMVFFRGGYAHNDQVRNDLLTGNQFAGNVLGGGKTDNDGWYTGAGFDYGLTDDVWGMMNNTEVMAELMFEYKNFGKKKFDNAPATGLKGNAGSNSPACTLINLAANGGATGGTPVPNAAGTAGCNNVTVTQFTLSAAPKFKFMKGSKFRPWIIPVGLAIHVISPPSNGVTVLNPGAMFAAGAEYQIWKEIKVGMDARYHWTGYDADGVNTNGLTAGGYLGIGF